MRRRSPRALFVQATEAGGYPPIIHASSLLALGGWDVTILNAPISGYAPTLPDHPRITIRNSPPRASHVMTKRDYLRYVMTASRLAATLRPDVVYASDPSGAAPGLVAAKIARAALIYHEHDTPNPGTLNRQIALCRTAAAKRAAVVVFPNESRAGLAQAELGFRDGRLQIVWNVPRRSELPVLPSSPDSDGLILYYHGSITPERLPLSVVDAVASLRGGAKLWIMGYETPGAGGYLARLLDYGRRSGETLAEYFGQTPTRAALFERAVHATVGLALMPAKSGDLNMAHMTGASNKPFDYMASGLAMLVSDLPDWVDQFVQPGYARACDPDDAASVARQLRWFAAHPAERRQMGKAGRARIESGWHYEIAFKHVMGELDRIAA